MPVPKESAPRPKRSAAEITLELVDVDVGEVGASVQAPAGTHPPVQPAGPQTSFAVSVFGCDASSMAPAPMKAIEAAMGTMLNFRSGCSELRLMPGAGSSLFVGRGGGAVCPKARAGSNRQA